MVSLDDLSRSPADAEVEPGPGDETIAAEASSDAGLDATDATDAPFSCAAHASVQLCDDFDEDGAAFTKWSAISQINGGSVSLVASDDSPPSAAHFHDPSDAAISPQAYLSKSFVAAATKSITYQFDVRVEKFPVNDESFSFSPIRTDLVNNPGAQLFFSISDVNAVFSELVDYPDGGSFFVDIPLANRPAVGTWMHVEVDIAIGPPAMLSIYLDGAPAVAQSTSIDPHVTFGTPAVCAGVTYMAPTGQLAIVDVDDVIFDFQ